MGRNRKEVLFLALGGPGKSVILPDGQVVPYDPILASGATAYLLVASPFLDKVPVCKPSDPKEAIEAEQAESFREPVQVSFMDVGDSRYVFVVEEARIREVASEILEQVPVRRFRPIDAGLLLASLNVPVSVRGIYDPILKVFFMVEVNPEERAIFVRRFDEVSREDVQTALKSEGVESYHIFGYNVALAELFPVLRRIPEAWSYLPYYITWQDRYGDLLFKASSVLALLLVIMALVGYWREIRAINKASKALATQNARLEALAREREKLITRKLGSILSETCVTLTKLSVAAEKVADSVTPDELRYSAEEGEVHWELLYKSYARAYRDFETCKKAGLPVCLVPIREGKMSYKITNKATVPTGGRWLVRKIH